MPRSLFLARTLETHEHCAVLGLKRTWRSRNNETCRPRFNSTAFGSKVQDALSDCNQSESKARPEREEMAEISYYDADLSDAIEKLNDLMGKVAKAPPGVRPEMLAMAEVKLKEMVELKKGFQLALRQAPRDQVAAFREKFDEHCARVEELSSEFRWAKAEQERNGLFGDRAAASTAAAARGTNGLGNKELLDKTVDIQSKTEQSLMSTAKMVEQSKDIAAATAETLRSQREHIVEITDAVMGIEDSLQRADRLIRSFARRMATDRVILLFTFLVIVGIAGIVGYKSLNPDDTTFYVPDEVTPPDPTALYNTTVSAINSTLSS